MQCAFVLNPSRPSLRPQGLALGKVLESIKTGSQLRKSGFLMCTQSELFQTCDPCLSLMPKPEGVWRVPHEALVGVGLDAPSTWREELDPADVCLDIVFLNWRDWDSNPDLGNVVYNYIELLFIFLFIKDEKKLYNRHLITVSSSTVKIVFWTWNRQQILNGC